eukprot:3795779-Rhodomonas_salina.1
MQRNESIFCTSGGARGFGEWEQTRLILSICNNQTLEPATLYRFEFVILNPMSDRDPASLKISANGTTAYPPLSMTALGLELFGISDGTDVLRIVTPAFETKTIVQTSPVPLAENTIILQLTSTLNVAATHKGVVVITGLVLPNGKDDGITLQGFEVVQGVETPSKIFCGNNGSSLWSNVSISLDLNVCPGETMFAASSYVVRMHLTNPDTSVTSPAISISA